ncbi:radical SAM protein [Waltera sp.]|uniref:radical SAM protein n=1 Tax=Waltera sp. TaxID=2815806 RepID=UPI003AB9AC29
MEKLSVIWDVTRWCPWDCQICCMGAVNDPACRIQELSYEEKVKVLEQIAALKADRDVQLDMSGGEIMMDESHLKLIQKAAELLGREKVGISTSGININKDTAEILAKSTKDVELTLDCIPGEAYALRKKGYHVNAAAAVDVLKKAGVYVGVQTVLCKKNNTKEEMDKLLRWLCQHNVDVWSILRFFPVGRGADYAGEVLSGGECREVVEMINCLYKNLSCDKPELDFHYLMPGHKKSTSQCRCVRKSIGILPDGTVTACFWALDKNTSICEDKYFLGNVRENELIDILKNEKSGYWLNGTHCCELFCA